MERLRTSVSRLALRTDVIRRAARMGLPFLTAFALVAVGCGGADTGDTGSAAEESTESAQTSESADESYHAPAGYVPGSYEDWCGGHGVPESACTRCNSSLIPAFQATGDWCAEHGIPESQCKACNPDLVINRPPRLEGE